ncbi:MAG: dockerin type I domain-containing protein [Ruminococcus sp.]|nr:dockerin type I domain-containing protein [Ruminococcus sp.]
MMKKTVATVITALMIVSSLATPTYASSDFDRVDFLGDPNDDGFIDAKDATFILSAYARLATGEENVLNGLQIIAADVKTDGMVDAKDASAILSYYAYTSTGGTEGLRQFLINETHPPIISTSFTKKDLLNPDTEIATKAYEELTKQFKKDLYNGYIIDGVYGDTDGYYECKAMLAMLNHDQGIAPEVLSNVFEEYSEEEFYEYSDTLAFAAISELTKGNVDFTKYVLDEELAEFINTTNQAWMDSYTGKNTNFDTIIKEYFENNNFSNTDAIDDYLKFYYAIIAKHTLDRGMSSTSLKSGKELYDNNIVKPIFEAVNSQTTTE